MSDRSRLAAKIGIGAVSLCVPLVVYFEGTILRTYRDPIGILTSCTGHTGPELRMGQVYSRVGNLEQARRIYARLIEANPDLAVAHYNLGGIYFRMKKPTYAIREYTRALEIEPRSVHTLNALGVACKQLKHYDEAELRLKQAIRIDPGYAPAYYNLGLVFMEKHNYPNATSYLQRAIDLFGPDSPRGRTIAELLRSRRRAP